MDQDTIGTMKKKMATTILDCDLDLEDCSGSHVTTSHQHTGDSRSSEKKSFTTRKIKRQRTTFEWTEQPLSTFYEPDEIDDSEESASDWLSPSTREIPFSLCRCQANPSINLAIKLFPAERYLNEKDPVKKREVVNEYLHHRELLYDAFYGCGKYCKLHNATPLEPSSSSSQTKPENDTQKEPDRTVSPAYDSDLSTSSPSSSRSPNAIFSPRYKSHSVSSFCSTVLSSVTALSTVKATNTSAVASETDISFLVRFFATAEPAKSKKLIAEHWFQHQTSIPDDGGLLAQVRTPISRQDNVKKWLLNIHESDFVEERLPTSVPTERKEDEPEEEDWLSYRKSILQICWENPAPKVIRAKPVQLPVFCCEGTTRQMPHRSTSTITAFMRQGSSTILPIKENLTELETFSVTKIIEVTREAVRASLLDTREETKTRYFAQSGLNAGYFEVPATFFLKFNDYHAIREAYPSKYCADHDQLWKLACYTKQILVFSNTSTTASDRAMISSSMMEIAKEKRRIRQQQINYGKTDSISETLNTFTFSLKPPVLDSFTFSASSEALVRSKKIGHMDLSGYTY